MKAKCGSQSIDIGGRNELKDENLGIKIVNLSHHINYVNARQERRGDHSHVVFYSKNKQSRMTTKKMIF